MSARKRIIMGLRATAATMSQDWIEPVGRLSIVTRSSQQQRIGHHAIVNNRLPTPLTGTLIMPVAALAGSDFSRPPGQNYVGGDDPGGAAIAGLRGFLLGHRTRRPPG